MPHPAIPAEPPRQLLPPPGCRVNGFHKSELQKNKGLRPVWEAKGESGLSFAPRGVDQKVWRAKGASHQT
ncbi:hypothetical protein OCEANICA350_11281 [Oceanicaulis sp. 350]|nr:hypothetical protein OCEANICA350_11281 [Oceanicaulis sp. 350]